MKNQLLDGVPKDHNYKLLIESDEFKEIEIFSNKFLSANKRSLGKYAKKWVRDPLHQWSRQWEYPYVLNRIESFIAGKGKTKVLDAGSGITFFPYLIKSLHPSVNIHCADTDTDLESIYQQINSQGKETVDFSCSNLKYLPFDNEWFDVIYCISVLEHTDDYEKITEGFHRILKLGGRLIITFDVSLDGTRDISVEKGVELLNILNKKFAVVKDASLELSSDVLEPDIFTTRTIQDIDPKLLPWKLPQVVYQLHSFFKGGKFNTWPPLLTVYCLNLEKRS